MEINLGQDHFLVTISATKFDYSAMALNTYNTSWVVKAKDVDEAQQKGYKLLERLYPDHTYKVHVNSGFPYFDDPLDENITIKL